MIHTPCLESLSWKYFLCRLHREVENTWVLVFGVFGFHWAGYDEVLVMVLNIQLDGSASIATYC